MRSGSNPIPSTQNSTGPCSSIDSLSLIGLHGINLEVYGERSAKQMEGVSEVDKACEEVTLETWENRPFSAKLVEKALASLRPFA